MDSLLKTKIKFSLLALPVTVWALLTGYYQVFGIFPLHDDEGYLMITVRQFLEGKILYDEIYTQYGPAYYLYEQLIHSLPGLPVTHDATRLTTLLVWTLTGLLCGWITFRLTRSAVFGAISYVLTFLILFRTVWEPGHPQELCGLLVALILLLLTNGADEEKNRRFPLALAAAFTAFLFLIKINLGVFLGLAFAIALLSFTKSGWWQRIGLAALVALSVLLPFVMLGKYLSIGWIKLCVSIAVTVVAAALSGSLTPAKPFVSIKDYLILAAAFAGTAFLIVLGILLQGTSAAALLQGSFLQHLKFGDNFFQAAPIQRFVIFWSLLAFALAWGIAFFKNRLPRTTEIFTAFLKSAFGVSVILTSLWGYEGFLNNFALLSFAPPFLWLLLVKLPHQHRRESEKNDLGRIALFFTAVLLTLQIFPIAGTQMAYACYLMIVISVVCLHEGLAGLKNLFPAQTEKFYVRYGLAAAATIFLVIVCAYRFNNNYTAYRRQIPVGFDGASRLRIPEEKAALYTFLVENLKSGCDNFVTMPGFYSLNFWTKIEPPTTYNTTAWLTLLGNAQQQTIIGKLETHPRICAVHYPKLTTDGLRNRRVEEFPLARYILNDFKIAATVREHRFMTQNAAAGNVVYLAKILPNLAIEFVLPNRRQWEIARVEIFDWQQQRVLADSRENSVLILDEQNQVVALPLTVAASDDALQKYKLNLSASNQVNLPPPENLILRLYDADGSLIAFLPFDETR